MVLLLANVTTMTEKCPDVLPKTSGHFLFFVQKIGKFVQIFQHLSAGLQSHIQVKFFCQPNIRRTIHVALQFHDQILRCTCTDLPSKSQ